MSFKSDTSVEVRVGHECLLTVQTHGIPRSFDTNKNRCREFIAGVISMLSGYPGVRMTGQVDVWRSGHKQDSKYGFFRLMPDVNIDKLRYKVRYPAYAWSFHMYCEPMEYSAALAFAAYVVRVIYDNARLIAFCDVNVVNFEPVRYENLWNYCILYGARWHVFDLWESVRAATTIASVTHGNVHNIVICDVMKNIESMECFVDVIGSYICNETIMWKTFQRGECALFKDFGPSCKIYVVGKDSFGPTVCIYHGYGIDPKTNRFKMYIDIYKADDVSKAYEFLSEALNIDLLDAMYYIDRALIYAKVHFE